MTTTTQQIPSNPARDFANAILAETNNGQDLIDLLHDIAQGAYGATYNDRISANTILTDRGLGKCPRQSPVLSPVEGPAANGQSHDPAPETDVGAIRESPALREAPPAIPHNEPESPRLVTQIDDSLHQSLGPAPSAHNPTTNDDVEPAPYSIRGAIRESPEHENTDPSSIQTSIQNYILEITNNGETLRTALKDIAFADTEDPNVKASHRKRATTLLLDRLLGTDPGLVRNGVCPECRRRWTTHPDSHSRSQQSPDPAPVEDLRSDEERLAAIEADLNKMIDEGILTPDPNAPPIDISAYRMPKDFDITPYAAEEAAAFRAEIELRIERQKQWPEIEERRRKKLAQIYPSHSERDPPDS